MKVFTAVILLFIMFSSFNDVSYAQAKTIPLPKIGIDIGTADSPKDVSVTMQMLILLTVLSLAPSILIMTTSYLRLIVVFHFLKTALGTQQMPPSQMLAGVALFITFFIMAPTWTKVNDQAIKPYMDGKMTMDAAYDKGIEPIREFMFRNVRDADLELFLGLSNMPRPRTRQDLPTYVLVPAFAISELRAGFIIGFFLFIPFLMVDMIVSSVLMSMGMMMLPPMLVSLPFKILLFILVDGWNLIIGSVVRSFG
ncbi:MAG: flagellar type III secretion system pore protein FliP [Ignavibacteria bacterium]|jgi:flagellar biosynthetic protein FliP|nr:flagellar type III secretion system pore protein FliP [Ignavibacteria bacterium]MCU7503753.1 flagellar type III secretion system pore protein FliP [Ignavibacteria bacterium]MCU7517233.1 flagellar type III secretion system pore protein FliP [Ignavibacteria bacterium]